MTRCDIAGDERSNTDKIHTKCQNEILRRKSFGNQILSFPLRIDIVQPGDSVSAELFLSIDSTLMGLYIFNYDEELFKTEGGATSCGRIGGFSYILSETTNNVVLSKFDLEDHKIIAHEFGHFFGLLHTFEEYPFGKEKNTNENYLNKGDRICDTSPDPVALYEVYVNYSKCEMLGHRDVDGIPYKPLINNFMSYYKPCYLQRFSFTPDQVTVLRFAAESDLRINYSR
ncbi:M43 family zinc metalloprotease [bacterium]|nr:M43 family zinc metalloprotease [bacterium]